ncbi:putative transcriptional regulator [Frankia canadensis]|uniref:Putative transcriptional regulator n=1 Tax=Frankia canadensis TaxID=1836972 RepID=A0A2I2KUT4_9ACTN|nr:BlaI/MecI/CopY family transcriptional regulator [Frankia canadensis]SNQ49424.1 putative transcriptional regulator [Frankia canadensis]SOU56714.1 putative transcriptional regulator [Frankia canadensis]
MRRREPHRRVAGELESAVLGVLWDADGPLTPGQTQLALAGDGLELAYTSVATTLARLHGKGLLDRTAAGRGHAYAPAAAAAAEIADRMRGLLGDGRGRAVVLSHFVAGLTPDDEATLLSLLAAAENAPHGSGGTESGGSHESGWSGPGGTRESGPR